MEIRFFVPGRPKSTQTGSVWRNPKTGRAIPSRRNPGWSKEAGKAANRAMDEAGLKPLAGPVSLGISIIMPRLKDMRKAPEYPMAPPDIDNAIKGLKDAWEGVLYENDKQVVRYHLLEKVWASPLIPEQAEGGIAVTCRAL